MALNTTPLWAGWVNSLFQLYYWRPATSAELSYWSTKSDADLRPKLIPNSATQLALNKPKTTTVQNNSSQFSSAASTQWTPALKPLPWSNVAPIAPVAATNTINNTTINGGSTVNVPSNLSTKPLGEWGVQSLFKLYYWRDATKDEIAYWSTKSDAELRPKLIPNSERELAKASATTQTEKTQIDNTANIAAEKEARRKAGLEYIASQNLSPEMSAIMKQLLEDWLNTEWKVFTKDDVASMLKTATINAQTNLDPYFAKKTDQEIEDVKNKFAFIRSEAARYAQQEWKSYKELLDKTKQSLESRWLTFSGQWRKELGKQWANAWNKDTGVGWTNTFNGVEWEVPMQRRYDWEDKMNAWNERNLTLWIDTERNLWSSLMEKSWLSWLQITNPYAPWSIDYTQWRTWEQYLVKKTINWVPQEWYIRSWSQSQFLNPNWTEAMAWDANYRYLSNIELEKQKAIEAARLASLTSQLKPVSTK